MKIAINALSVYSGGGLTSMLNLLPALEQVDHRNMYIIIISKKQVELLDAIPKSFQTHFAGINPRNVLVRVLYEQLMLPFVLLRLKIDWLYSVGSMTSLLSRCKILLLIENANPFSSLDVGWSHWYKFRNFIMREFSRVSAKRATKVRFLSKNSRNIISKSLNIPQFKTCVIYHGVNKDNFVNPDDPFLNNIPTQFILTVANIDPHKNLHTLMEAFDLLVKKSGYSGRLVIVGKPTYARYYDFLKKRQRQLEFGEKIHFVGWVDQKHLPAFYRRADVFVLPSLVETFGLPVIEAMQYQAPVVVPESIENNFEYFIPFSELCGEAALYFNALDKNQLCDMMYKVIAGDEMRAELVEKGVARSAIFSWRNTAINLITIFEN